MSSQSWEIPCPGHFWAAHQTLPPRESDPQWLLAGNWHLWSVAPGQHGPVLLGAWDLLTQEVAESSLLGGQACPSGALGVLKVENRWKGRLVPGHIASLAPRVAGAPTGALQPCK